MVVGRDAPWRVRVGFGAGYRFGFGGRAVAGYNGVGFGGRAVARPYRVGGLVAPWGVGVGFGVGFGGRGVAGGFGVGGLVAPWRGRVVFTFRIESVVSPVFDVGVDIFHDVVEGSLIADYVFVITLLPGKC